METRALAIAFFYAIGTAVGGITGPFLFGKMIESGSESQVAIAFFIGAGVMAIGGIVELVLGVKAEGEQLEDIATPLSATRSSPGMAVSAPVAVVGFEREVEAISRVVADRDDGVERRELARLVGARFWGPGRFGSALAVALREGRVRRICADALRAVGTAAG